VDSILEIVGELTLGVLFEGAPDILAGGWSRGSLAARTSIYNLGSSLDPQTTELPRWYFIGALFDFFGQSICEALNLSGKRAGRIENPPQAASLPHG